MKKTVKITLSCLFVLMAVSFTSCKYDEGPFLSFRTAEERLVGYWKLANVQKNGVDMDSTELIANNPGCYYAFFSERMISVSALDGTLWRESEYGSWDFQNRNKELYVNFLLKNKRYAYTAVIKRLTRDQLIYEYYDAYNNLWRFEFESRSSMYY